MKHMRKTFRDRLRDSGHSEIPRVRGASRESGANHMRRLEIRLVSVTTAK